MNGGLDFAERIAAVDPTAGTAECVEVLGINVGRRCEIACTHCHHRCSPDATEMMSEQTMEQALGLAIALDAGLLDVTGGSPELWPHLPDLLVRAAEASIPVRLRTNLIELGMSRSRPLAELLARTRTTLLASLPEAGLAGASRLRPDDARPATALGTLVSLGFGTDSGPPVEFAVNPELGLPSPEAVISKELEPAMTDLGVTRFRIRSIANAPLGRFADRLAARGDRHAYLHQLADAFDSASVKRLPCRNGVAVAWDGGLYDCDFNVSAGLALAEGPETVGEALTEPQRLVSRRINFGPHCFSCTIGAGSG